MVAHEDFDRSTMSSQKMARLAELREEARALEQEIEADTLTTRNPDLGPSSSPLGKASRVPRREFATAGGQDPQTSSRVLAASCHKTVLSMREAVRANSNTIQLAFHRADRERSKRVAKVDFMRLLNRCNVPTSRGAADEIWSLLDQDHLGRIDYGEFLALFNNALPDRVATNKSRWPDGKTVLPPALPTPPGPGGTHAERPITGAERPVTSRSTLSTRAGRPGTQASGRNVQGAPSQWGEGTVSLMSEVNDWVRYYRKKFEELFDQADLQGTGQVSKQQCQRIFQWVGVPLTQVQLDEILGSIGESTGSKTVRYAALLNKLTELSMDRPDLFDHIASVHFAPTHLLQIIKRRVKHKYKGALWLLREEDHEGTGEISRTALLRILKGIGLELSETQLEEVLIQLGLWPNDSAFGTVNVHHFLKHCVKEHATPGREEFLERSIASKIPKEIATAPKMNCQQLLKTLQDKMELSIKYPRDMFLKLDVDKDGYITKDELTTAFTYFNLYPTPTEIDELFRIVDEDRTGLISFQQFLKKLAPKRIYKFMSNTVPSDPQRNYIPTGTLSPVPRPSTAGQLQGGDLATIMRKQVRPNLRLVHVLLCDKDLKSSGHVSKKYLLQVLRKVDVYVSMEQMNQALDSLGIPRGDFVDIEQFLAAIGPDSSSVRKDSLRDALSRRATAGAKTAPGFNLKQGLGFGTAPAEQTGGKTHRGRLETETYGMEAQRTKEEEERGRLERRLQSKWVAVTKALTAVEDAAVEGRSAGKEEFVRALRKIDSEITPQQAMAIASVMDFSLGPSSIGQAQLAEILGMRARPGGGFVGSGVGGGGGGSKPSTVDRLSLTSSRGGRVGTAGSGRGGLKALLSAR